MKIYRCDTCIHYSVRGCCSHLNSTDLCCDRDSTDICNHPDDYEKKILTVPKEKSKRGKKV